MAKLIPECSLGLGVGNWIESNCVIPDGPRMGQPYELTNEMWEFLAFFYEIDSQTTRFIHERGAQLVRPQKHGKGPFSAAIICAEAAGPVRFSHWDGSTPVGKAWETPWIQVTAVSEDQTDNVFRALLPMIQLSESLNLEISDSGLTRINLPGGGYVEPVTASARSRLGQRITFAVQDETHSWVVANGGRKLADNQRRNLAGMGGRFLETTNAWDPVENSVAQQTAVEPGVYHDDAEPIPGSIRNKRERREVMKSVYRDSVTGDRSMTGRDAVTPWVDLHRIDQEIEALLEHDPAQAERFFLNRKLASEGAAFDFEQWKKLAEPMKVPADSVIVIGVDGARYDDACAAVACDVATGYIWPLAIVERPDDAGPDYEHDLSIIDGAVKDAFDANGWQVWRVYCDPQHIKHLIEGWQNLYGTKRVADWETYRPRQIAFAVRNFTQALTSGDFKHSGDEVLTRHIQNSRRKRLTVLDDKERPMHTLSKPAQHSPLKIDGAMAAILAWECRNNAIKDGAVYTGDTPELPDEPKPERYTPGMAMNLERQTVPVGDLSGMSSLS